MERATDANTDTLTITADQGLQHRHIAPDFGLPYATAGVRSFPDAPKPFTRATATCPACGYVAMGHTPKKAAAEYARHFAEREQQEATIAAGNAFAIRLTKDSTHRSPGGPLVVDYPAGTVLLAVREVHASDLVASQRSFGPSYSVPWFDGSTRAVGFDHAERV